VARLTSLEMRKNLIRNVKSLKVTTDMIISNWAKEKVFINERLTKFKMMLFSQTRLGAKSKQYKFIWRPLKWDTLIGQFNFILFGISYVGITL